jgi:V/A-type H+/Na+-transporting ATPase subunit A
VRAHVVTLGGRTGSVTIIGAVSPPGGDMTEPVTAHTQRLVRSVWTVDRELAYARHNPAAAWVGSFSQTRTLLVRDTRAWVVLPGLIDGTGHRTAC